MRTVSSHNLSTRSALALLLAVALSLAGTLWVILEGSATARAQAAEESLAAPVCDHTNWTPLEIQTTISGERLDSYNDGNPVPLYGNDYNLADISSAFPPICGVREVNGEPVSEWMYCTDLLSDPCVGLDEEGRPIDYDGQPLGPNLPIGDNPRLDDDQSDIISYLLTHGIPWEHDYVGGLNFAPGSETTSTHTDNSTQANRQALQDAVWCVSDYDNATSQDFKNRCDQFLGTEVQQRILEAIPDAVSPILELSPPTPGELPTGLTARFTVTTNLYHQPITVSADPFGVVTVCDGDATLTGNELIVEKPSGLTAEVTLCVTSNSPGEVTLSISGTPAGVENLKWNQATANVGAASPCQVYATFDTTIGPTIEDSALVEFISSGTTGSGSTGSLDAGSLIVGSTGSAGSAGLGSTALGSLGSSLPGSSDLGSVDLGSSLPGSSGSTGSDSGSLGSTLPGSTGSDSGSLGSSGSDSGSRGSTGSADLGSAGTGSAALGSAGLGSLGSAALGSQDTSSPGIPGLPGTSTQQPTIPPPIPSSPGTTTSPAPAVIPAPQAPKGQTGAGKSSAPHAINAGDARMDTRSKVLVGTGVALLALSILGGLLAGRRKQ